MSAKTEGGKATLKFDGPAFQRSITDNKPEFAADDLLDNQNSKLGQPNLLF